jgi:hypothetical protein
VLLVAALPATAEIISHSGSFSDPTNQEGDGDDFTLTNSGISEADIITLEIDLSSGLDAQFHTADFAFTPDAASALLTGFTGSAVFTGTDVLTLTFTSFNPGDTFLFQIDVDDDNNRVQTANIINSVITATFDIYGGSDLSIAMVADGANGTTWNDSVVVTPEPGTLSLLSLGLIGLAWESRRARVGRPAAG